LRWKQYQNINDLNSKVCLSCQIKVYVCVSADTKTWAACPTRAVLRYIRRPQQGKGQATGGLRLLAGKHAGILTDIQTKVNKKTKK
jgi:hypothetical protein